MQEYVIQIETLSDIVFGSGSAVPGVVDLEVLHDNCGIPYMKGKTIKGKLREEYKMLSQNRNGGKWDEKQAERLFGTADMYDSGTLKFSDVKIHSEIETVLRDVVLDSQNEITAEDILRAMTEERSFTKINYSTGVAEKGSLRKMQVISRGIIFYCTVTVEDILPEDEAALAASVAALRYLGLKETRGFGHVRCSLFKSGQDITEAGIEEFVKGAL